MTTTILIVLSLAIIVWATASFTSRRQAERLRNRGLLPEPGQIPSVDHVKKLAAAGETILAIKMYREIHHRAGLKEAKDAVEKMRVG